METIAIVVPICSVVVSLITMLVAYFAYKRNKAKDDKEEIEKKGQLEANIEYIKSRVDEIISDEKETKTELLDLRQRVTRVEESSKQAHKRIDELVQKAV
jgi:uncharacterized membrane protein